MAVDLRKRPCRYCRRWFRPHVRLGERQYACSDPGCQAQRQRENEARWLERDPGYFRGRGGKHRIYRAEHPQAKRQWRAAHPEARERERRGRARRRQEAPTRRAVEQEAIALELVDPQGVGKALASAVTQKAMMPQLHVLVGLASALGPAVAQKPIEGALLHWHDRGREVLRGALAHEQQVPPR